MTGTSEELKQAWIKAWVAYGFGDYDVASKRFQFWLQRFNAERKRLSPYWSPRMQANCEQLLAEIARHLKPTRRTTQLAEQQRLNSAFWAGRHLMVQLSRQDRTMEGTVPIVKPSPSGERLVSAPPAKPATRPAAAARPAAPVAPARPAAAARPAAPAPAPAPAPPAAPAPRPSKPAPARPASPPPVPPPPPPELPPPPPDLPVVVEMPPTPAPPPPVEVAVSPALTALESEPTVEDLAGLDELSLEDIDLSDLDEADLDLGELDLDEASLEDLDLEGLEGLEDLEGIEGLEDLDDLDLEGNLDEIDLGEV